MAAPQPSFQRDDSLSPSHPARHPGPLDSQIHDLQRRVEALRQRGPEGPSLADSFLEELSTAQEELRAAAAELHEQHLQLIDLQDERVRRTEAEARAAARDEFFAIAAHELRTPITSLRGFSQVLIRYFEDPARRDPDRAHRAVRRIEEQTHHIAALIERLLDVSRLDQGLDLRLHLEPTALAALARRVARAFEVTSETHQLVLQCPPEPVVAHVDPLRFEQVLTNLVSNALRHTPGGDVVISVRSDAGGGIHVGVRDQGHGVPPADRERIFQRFYQADLDRNYVRGLGLGLYISRRIVEAHGGRLTLRDASGGGSHFVASLPHSSDPPAPR